MLRLAVHESVHCKRYDAMFHETNQSPDDFIPEDLQEICSRFEQELESGNEVTIEDFLTSCLPDRKPNLFALLLRRDLAARQRNNRELSTDDYLRRFPDFQSIIQETFDRCGRTNSHQEDATLQSEPDCENENVTVPPEEKTLLFVPLNERPTKATTDFSYVLKEGIGEFSYGRIFHAEHPGLKRGVKLRVLNERVSRSIRDGFLDAAQRAAALADDHINSTILEAGQQKEMTFVAERIDDMLPLPDLSANAVAADMWGYPRLELATILHEGATGMRTIHNAGLAHGSVNAKTFAWDSVTRTSKVNDLGNVVESCQQDIISNQRHDLNAFGKTFIELLTSRSVDELKNGFQSRRAYRQFFKRSNPYVPVKIVDLLEYCLKANRDTLTGFDEIAKALEPDLKYEVVRPSWADRLGTLTYEAGLLTIFISPTSIFLMTASQRGSGISWVGYSVVAIAGLLWIMFSPGRRIRNIYLYDRSGQKARIPHRLGRAAIQLGFCAAGGYVGHLMATTGSQFRDPVTDGAFIIAGIFLSQLFLYLSSFFLPGRRPLHDYLSRATWMQKNLQEIPFSEEPPVYVMSISNETATEGWQFDKYVVDSLLGQGGMGAVYKASDTVLKRPVALKKITALSAESERRFQQEARLAAKLSHPNVAQVYGFGSHQGEPYLVMEYIEGKTLQRVVKDRGHLPPSEAWDYIYQAANGLKAAYELGIIHRDIKPSNLIVTQDGHLKVMDFGVSKLLGQEEPAAQPSPDASTSSWGDVDLTKTGALLGTPHYMSPEQAQCEAIDCRSDIYSLGLTLYYSLVGHPPFEGTDSIDVIYKQCEEDPPPIKTVRLSKAQQFVLQKMTAKNPDDRYLDYDELLHDLEATRPARPILARLRFRFYAEILDSLLVFFLSLAVVWTGLIADWQIEGINSGIGVRSANFYSGILMSLLLLGFNVVGIGRWGATPAKLLLGLRVVGHKQSMIGYRRAIVRYVTKYPFAVMTLCITPLMTLSEYYQSLFRLLGSLILVVSAVVAIKNSKRRALHDMAAKTQVMRYPMQKNRIKRSRPA